MTPSGASALPGRPHIPGFTLQRRLGRGGQGTVWLAQRAAHGLDASKSVALKLVELTAENESPFRTEVGIALAASHPGIVPAFDAGLAHGWGYLAMEWIDGVDLASLSRAADGGRARLFWPVALHVVERVLLALDYLHRLEDGRGWMGVVHCDLSPRNVLVSRHGDVKICDFGAACRAGSGQRVRRGTPRYMAPEQRGAGLFDHRADLFAIGVVLDELLRGEAFTAAGASLPIAGVPASAESFRRALLERAPRRRPRSAGEALARLGTVASVDARGALARAVLGRIGGGPPKTGAPPASRSRDPPTGTATRTLTGAGQTPSTRAPLAASVWAASVAACAAITVASGF